MPQGLSKELPRRPGIEMMCLPALSAHQGTSEKPQKAFTKAGTSLKLLSAAAAAAKSLQLCPTLCDPMDCSPPGSFLHGIFQARVLEWGAIAFSLCSLTSKNSPFHSSF